MVSDIIESVNDYYATGECRISFTQVEDGVFRIDFPGGEPGVHMVQAVKDFVSSEEHLYIRSKKDATTWIVTDSSV